MRLPNSMVAERITDDLVAEDRPERSIVAETETSGGQEIPALELVAHLVAGHGRYAPIVETMTDAQRVALHAALHAGPGRYVNLSRR